MSKQRTSRSRSKTSFGVALNEAEAARLREYAERKDMSTSAVLRQALRVYDLLEQTPGAYEAVNALTHANIGPKLHPADAEPVTSPKSVERDAQVKELLESYFWLNTLEPNTRYVRLQDDHDGEFVGYLSVVIGEDGDAWVTLDGASARFRMPLVGGGASQCTRTALVILAEAIRRDNIEAPMRLAKIDAPAPARADPGCICKGNWRAIVKEVEAQMGQGFTSHDGKAFTFIGVVHSKDDYYYGMWSRQHGLRLLSCVGSIEGHGYTAAPRQQAP